MACLDHEGNELEVGSYIYIPVQITSIVLGPNPTITGTTGYSGTVVGGVPGTDTHTGGKPTWPAMPG